MIKVSTKLIYYLSLNVSAAAAAAEDVPEPRHFRQSYGLTGSSGPLVVPVVWREDWGGRKVTRETTQKIYKVWAPNLDEKVLLAKVHRFHGLEGYT